MSVTITRLSIESSMQIREKPVAGTDKLFKLLSQLTFSFK